ncbi:MAG: DNA-directed RNA polymerase specialized sigma24 family protein [Planctomycetota bacterium]|jgi:DNA-directed RNA polymerase specialized sigma24 family protein
MLSDPYSLLPTAYRAAVAVVKSPIMAEEASERAIYQLTLAILEGSPPRSPKAWLRVVARRSACALLRSEWARTRSMDLSDVAAKQPAYVAPKSQSSWVRESLQTALTPRQREALEAAMTCNTTRAAARTCGMEPRDFRRSLGSISRRAKALLDETAMNGQQLPGCEAGMQV